MTEIKNRSAFHEYFFDNKYVAGIVLTGTEVKSLRDGKASFNDSYCIIHKGEMWLKSLHIAEYSHGTVNNHDPVRDRKLLLQKREITKIEGKLKEKGYTTAKSFDEVTVLFSDIKGFTHVAESMTAQELVKRSTPISARLTVSCRDSDLKKLKRLVMLT